MDDYIRKLDTSVHKKETELNELFTKIQKLEDEIATLQHKKTGLLGVIFEVDEEKEKE